MKVKIFDESHEKDLETSINNFLLSDIDVIDIKYDIDVTASGEEQIYCFSAMIIYKDLWVTYNEKKQFYRGYFYSYRIRNIS